MDRYAPRKILQSSSDKPVLPQRCIARLQLLLTDVDGDAGKVEAVVGVGSARDGETPAYSVARTRLGYNKSRDINI